MTGPAPRPAWHRRVVAIVAAGTSFAFFIFASASAADTGNVYVDGNLNVAAGHDFFGGSTPAGFGNIGLGYSVMPALGTGSENIAIGNNALIADTTGGDNLAAGFWALGSNTSGSHNVAGGSFALYGNTTGSDNVASGAQALDENTTGEKNVATGAGALFANAVGNDNVAAGYDALLNSTGNSNVGIGSGAGHRLTTGSNNLDIANAGIAGESATIRIGTANKQTRAFLAGVDGASIRGPAEPVLVNARGQLGTATATFERARRPLSATAGRRLLATVKRQQRELRRQGAEIRRLREQAQKGD